MENPKEQQDQRCKACDHPRLADSAQGMLRTRLDAMTEAAQHGCMPCSILEQGIKKFMSASLDADMDTVEELRLDFNMSGTRRSLEVHLLGSDISLSFFYSNETPWLLSTLPELSVGATIPTSTSADESFTWCLEQLQECSLHHEECGLEKSSPLPRRVLDLGLNTADSIQLYESKGETERYCALSYCWGPRPLSRTLSSNIESHIANIDLEHLPLTYRETIAFVRKLGIQYLWIDSLCIVQDDREDWRREAANMASIYRNSYLVISAAKSPAADGGLFASFTPQGCSVVTTNEDGNEETVHVRQSLPHVNTSNTSEARLYSNFPTLQRGWVFQERFLSSRVLHFGSQELSWECLHQTACQCTGKRSHSESSRNLAGSSGWLGRMLQRSVRAKSYYSAGTWASMDEAELRVCWRNLVEDYTNLDLTFEKDIFPAVSGLAKQFCEVRPSSYLAGLWEKSLIGDLLWHVEPNRGIAGNPERLRRWTKRPSRWRAPSWSWAAVRGPVVFINSVPGFEPSCEILEIECTPSGTDSTGELVSGHILLRGTLVPATIDYHPRSADRDIMPYSLWNSSFMNGMVGNLHADYDTLGQGPGHVPPGSAVFFLMIGKNIERFRAYYFLVLRELKLDMNDQLISYERIGMLELSGGRSPIPNQFWFDYVLAPGKDAVVRVL